VYFLCAACLFRAVSRNMCEVWATAQAASLPSSWGYHIRNNDESSCRSVGQGHVEGFSASTMSVIPCCWGLLLDFVCHNWHVKFHFKNWFRVCAVSMLLCMWCMTNETNAQKILHCMDFVPCNPNICFKRNTNPLLVGKKKNVWENIHNSFPNVYGCICKHHMVCLQAPFFWLVSERYALPRRSLRLPRTSWEKLVIYITRLRLTSNQICL